MAKPEHVAKLKEGVDAWNNWRWDNQDVKPDLSGANLRGIKLSLANLIDTNFSNVDLIDADLSKAKLKRADFFRAILIGTDFKEANLEEANLWETNLTQADFSGALVKKALLHGAKICNTNLCGACLDGVDFSGANFTGANLEGASLLGADLSDTHFIRANLYRAHLGSANLRRTKISESILLETNIGMTYLNNCIISDCDLSKTINLKTVRHHGPSSIGIDTIYKSKGKIPKIFLRGCGVPENIITYMKSLVGQTKQIDFFPCFISYSHADKSFARRLYDTLQGRGIRCWLDEHDAKVGDPIQEAIDRGFRLTDKVILCCSKDSLNSAWVSRELTKAFSKEEQFFKQNKKKSYVLVPLNLDGYLFLRKNKEYVWVDGWADEIRNRISADFKGWKKDTDIFDREFKRVIKALEAGAS